MIRPLHPFPARMAPEIAIEKLREAGQAKVVLDPMVGSGTVLRHAAELGHRGIGFDLDPLAVLMTKVATTPVREHVVRRLMNQVVGEFRSTRGKRIELPWIDDDSETSQFVRYWFGLRQRRYLRSFAGSLQRLSASRISTSTRAAVDVLRIALSRIIITKDRGASLARDISHSRPHKVEESSDYEVLPAFERSVCHVMKIISNIPPALKVDVSRGDARSLKTVENNTIDIVLTSPPYLNAIDYLRGHKLSLVWLGYRLSELRAIRSNSIGAERAPDIGAAAAVFEDIQHAMCDLKSISSRHRAMIARYSEDIYRMMSETARVLKRSGRAILVVGNSCLKGVFVRNSSGIVRAASMVGLKLQDENERKLPDNRRYLPMPLSSDDPLGARMRTETILSFGRP